MTDKTKQQDTLEDAGRRKLMAQGAAVAGGLAVFAAGYSETVGRAVTGLVHGTAGTPTADAVRGNSLTPEFRIDPLSGALSTQPGQTVSPSVCLGCWTQCGIRVRVDNEANRILRVAGNPYHPLATTQPADMRTPVRDVYSALGGDAGIEGRATACGRGAAMFEQLTSPYRVLQPLKRVGKRGEGKWQTISFEQLVEEICEGGDLFGEGHVDGLRAIFDRETLIDPANPEYGPLANQLLFTDAGNEGRTPFVRRFTQQSFGSVNFSNHGSYCGQTHRVGTAAALGDLPGMPHGKPDWDNARFGLFIGTAPAQAGNPFQRQGRQLAEARTRTDKPVFEYVVVSPTLPATSNVLSDGSEWLAVKPAGDLALVMGMIRWILDNRRYDAGMLAQPGPAAMQAAGEASWSNATHLLVDEPEHPRFGTFLRGADLGWSDAEAYVVQRADGELAAHTQAEPAELFVERMVTLDGQPVRVSSALSRLRAEARRMGLEEYARESGVSVEKITALAERFTRYGKQAVANSHGGTMSGAGFYTAYAVGMLNTLIGNLNVKGGLVVDAGQFPPFGPGPRYNIGGFAGKVDPKGVALSRHRFPYEKSSEYRRKKEAGQSPYPASAPWYPAVGGLSSEMIAAALDGYPYRAKVWINHMGNQVYGIAGWRHVIEERLRDPKLIPLSIAVNPFINETSALADYIVPDTLTYESWGVSAPWNGVVAKASSVRWPVVEPRVAKTAEGEPISLESFLIATAKRLGMPGFGTGAIRDAEGNRYDLNSAADFYLRGFANIAYAGGQAVPEASDDDLSLTGVQRFAEHLQRNLKPEEWRRVALLMSRGGRFARIEEAWNDKGQLRQGYAKPQQVWYEDLANMRHSLTGERYSGCPTWYPVRMADGRPMRELYGEDQWPMLMISFKSHLMSAYSIGADRLRQVHPHNPVYLHRDDAARLGIGHGDTVRLVTPGGAREGVALVRDGLMPGTIAVEHGYGHTELGARAHQVDGLPMPHNPALGAGVNLNDLGFADPTRADRNVWIDWVSGAAVRQGLPARIERA